MPPLAESFIVSRFLRWVPGLHPLGADASLLSPGTRDLSHAKIHRRT